MNKRTNFLTMKGNPLTLLGDEVKPGDKAPNFTAVNNDLSTFSFDDVKGKTVIISVVPSIDTPVCDLQTRTFNEKATNLSDDIVILTISVDLPFAQSRYCGANGIDKVKTISDHKDLSFGLSYGFVIEELRLLSRGIVIIDKDKTVRYVEYVSEVGNHPNYDQALVAVQELV